MHCRTQPAKQDSGEGSGEQGSGEGPAHGGLHGTRAMCLSARGCPAARAAAGPAASRRRGWQGRAGSPAPSHHGCTLVPITHGCPRPRARRESGCPRAPAHVPHVPRCCSSECKSAVGPVKNNKPSWVSARHRGAAVGVGAARLSHAMAPSRLPPSPCPSPAWGFAPAWPGGLDTAIGPGQEGNAVPSLLGKSSSATMCHHGNLCVSWGCLCVRGDVCVSPGRLCVCGMSLRPCDVCVSVGCLCIHGMSVCPWDVCASLGMSVCPWRCL